MAQNHQSCPSSLFGLSWETKHLCRIGFPWYWCFHISWKTSFQPMLKPANVAILKASVLPIFLEAAYQGNPWVEVDFTEGILSWTKQCSVHIFTGHCNLDEKYWNFNRRSRARHHVSLDKLFFLVWNEGGKPLCKYMLLLTRVSRINNIVKLNLLLYIRD